MLLGLLGGFTGPQSLSAEVIAATDAETGLTSWEWRHAGVSVRLVQRLPDQTRAFFLGRGFSSTDADTIGTACVFQTIFRNDGDAPIDFDLDDWQLTHQGKTHHLQTRERWEKIWQERDVSQAARIAFRWSLLPTRQHFEPGDYNWGMSSFGLPPGTRFDLSLRLIIGGEITSAKIPEIICAEDRS